MSASAPAPAVIATDGTLWLAYRISRDPHHCAVVRFHQVTGYSGAGRPEVPGALIGVRRGVSSVMPLRHEGNGTAHAS